MNLMVITLPHLSLPVQSNLVYMVSAPSWIMSYSSSTTATVAPMPVTSSVTVRLNHTNYMLWRAQMITHLRRDRKSVV